MRNDVQKPVRSLEITLKTVENRSLPVGATETVLAAGCCCSCCCSCCVTVNS